MNNSPNDNLIRAVHASGRRLVMALTGGGSAAIGWLLGVPGCSRTVLEAVVPYSAEALTDFLRARPEQFCAPTTARTMAAVARIRELLWYNFHA